MKLRILLTRSITNSVSCCTGATLSKGLNRGLGTLTAGGFALAVSELSSSMGNFGNVILIICTFVVGEYIQILKSFCT